MGKGKALEALVTVTASLREWSYIVLFPTLHTDKHSADWIGL